MPQSPLLKRRDPKFLIDGYNLLFQSNFVGKSRSNNWLRRARGRLITFLSTKLGNRDSNATVVVFDASQHGATQESYVDASGISVLFANDHPEADDLLEELIRVHSHPKTLTVVTSDNRIRRKAMARKSISLDSETFLTTLENRPASPADQNVMSKDEEEDASPSDSEVNFWLREFGHPPD